MGKVVMVVDDNEVDRLIVSEALKQAGHEVVVATDGGSALVMWAELHIDAIVIDQDMGVIKGTDVIRFIRRSDPNMPILLVSARNLSWLRRKPTEAGATGWVQKTGSYEYLVHKLGQLLAGPVAA